MLAEYFLSIALLIMGCVVGLDGQDLAQYRWSKRVIILVDQTPDAHFLKEQMNALLVDPTGLQDRDIVIITLDGQKGRILWPDQKSRDHAFVTTLNTRFPGGPKGAGFYLVGLDGGVKKSSYELVSLHSLFAIIDKMPMRRSELNDIPK